MDLSSEDFLIERIYIFQITLDMRSNLDVLVDSVVPKRAAIQRMDRDSCKI